MEPEQHLLRLLLFVVTHALAFGIGWAMCELRQARRKLKQVKDDFRRDKARYSNE